MGFFSKRQSDERSHEDAAIADFWQWWASEGKARAAAAFDGKTEEAGAELGDAIGDHLSGLGLAYETGPGTTARHALVFTPAGNPDLDAIADRWLAAAPPADEVFEYDNRRRAIPDASGIAIGFGEHRFAIAETAVLAEHGGGKVHVHVVNDGFAEAPDEVAGQVAFLFLDALLGERVVEKRIGAVTYGADHREGEIPLLDLPAVVAAG